jgi:hypothetical protein
MSLISSNGFFSDWASLLDCCSEFVLSHSETDSSVFSSSLVEDVWSSESSSTSSSFSKAFFVSFFHNNAYSVAAACS